MKCVVVYPTILLKKNIIGFSLPTFLILLLIVSAFNNETIKGRNSLVFKNA